MLPFVRMLEYGNIKPGPPGIKKIATSNLHCAFLYTNGSMYLRGGGADYKMGIGNQDNILNQFLKVPFDVVDCWLGLFCTIILTSDLKMYIAGNKSYIGISGAATVWTEITSSFSTINVSTIKDIQLTSTYEGDGSCLILMQDGSLYGLGSNGYSVIGVPEVWITQPILMDTNVSKIDVQDNRAAGFYIKEGVLYRCGYGINNVLGTPGTNLTTYTALNIPDTVIDVMSTFKCTKILTRDVSGNLALYIAGDNSNVQFGTGQASTVKNTTFTKYNTIPNIDLNRSFSFLPANGALNAVRNNGTVYTTGASNSNGYGLGRPISTNIADRLSYFPIQFEDNIDYTESDVQFNVQGSSGLSYIKLSSNIVYWAGNRGYYTEQSSGSGNQDKFVKMILPE